MLIECQKYKTTYYCLINKTNLSVNFLSFLLVTSEMKIHIND